MKRLMLLLCFFYFQNTVASQPAQKRLKRNVLIFFDPSNSDGDKGAETTQLHAAIKFSTNVIIVATANLFLNVLRRRSLLGNSLEKFDLEFYTSAGLVLLIPKVLNGQTGLNKFTSANEALIAKNVHRSARVDNLKQLFIVSPENKQKYEWYVALNGHGLYGKRSSIVSFQEDIVGIYRGSPQELGIIAGMNLDDFQEFLHFLNDKVTTKVLYFNSCYAGELNLHLAFSNLVHRTINKLVLKPHIKLNYDIIGGALTGSATTVPLEQEVNISHAHSAQSIQALTDFQRFFDLSHRYFGDHEGTRRVKGQEGTKRITDKLLIELCTQLDRWSIVQSPESMIANLPQIKFVHQESFQVVPLSRKIFVLNNVLIKKQMLAMSRIPGGKAKIVTQKRSIDLESIQTFILLYSSDIEVPIRLSVTVTVPQFISMMVGPAVHVFDSLLNSFDVQNVARGQMVIPNIVPKYYVIKKMGDYANIILHVQATPVIGNQGADQLKEIFSYYFKQGDHYLALFSRNESPIQVKIPGSDKLDKKVQEIIDSITQLAHASLEKRIRELSDLFITLLQTLNEAGLDQRKKEPAVAMFLEALTYYSNARVHFERGNLLYRAFESRILTTPEKIINQFDDLFGQDLRQISYSKLMQRLKDLQQQAHTYVMHNPSDVRIKKIEKIIEGFVSGSLGGKLEILNNPQVAGRKSDLAVQAAAIADSLIARGRYQEAIDRLNPFTPITSTKIVKTYNIWLNATKDSNYSLAQKTFKQAVARATQLEEELKKFPKGVTPNFVDQKTQLNQLADFFKKIPESKAKPQPQPQSEEKPQPSPSTERAPDQAEMRHRLVRQYNEELSEDPTIMPYEEVTELWDNIRDKARKYLGSFGADEKISHIQIIAEGLGSVPTLEGKLAIKDDQNANNYYRKVRDYEVKKANALIEQASYNRAIDLLRPFTPDTSAKIIKIYIKMINYLAQQSRRSARDQATEALEDVKNLEREFNFFGGTPPQFKEEKAALEKLRNEL